MLMQQAVWQVHYQGFRAQGQKGSTGNRPTICESHCSLQGCGNFGVSIAPSRTETELLDMSLE